MTAIYFLYIYIVNKIYSFSSLLFVVLRALYWRDLDEILKVRVICYFPFCNGLKLVFLYLNICRGFRDQRAVWGDYFFLFGTNLTKTRVTKLNSNLARSRKTISKFIKTKCWFLSQFLSRNKHELCNSLGVTERSRLSWPHKIKDSTLDKI